MLILTQTLIITGIGVGLIFIGILCLWALMEVMVRFIKDPRKGEDEEVEQAAEVVETAAPATDSRRKAAALAVAVALARGSARMSISARSDSQISNWQSARRTMERQQNTQLFFRK